jgi:hypothetical protein
MKGFPSNESFVLKICIDEGKGAKAVSTFIQFTCAKQFDPDKGRITNIRYRARNKE